jgi:hypothetical protein
MDWMVSARSVLEPRFLASVSFNCSLSVLGVVVRWKGYFLASETLPLSSCFGEEIVFRKLVGTSSDLLAMSSRNPLLLAVDSPAARLRVLSRKVTAADGWSLGGLAADRPPSLLLNFRRYSDTLSSDGLRPRLLKISMQIN